MERAKSRTGETAEDLYRASYLVMKWSPDDNKIATEAEVNGAASYSALIRASRRSRNGRVGEPSRIDGGNGFPSASKSRFMLAETNI